MKHRNLFIVLTALATSSFELWATTYYVDARNGNDTRSGTSTFQPWRTISRVNKQRLKPSDQVLFRRACEWRETLCLTASGTSGKPIMFAAYGDGALPRLDGSDDYANAKLWTKRSENVWSTIDGTFPTDIGHIQLDGELMAARALSQADLNTQWQFYHDPARKCVMVWSTNNPALLVKRLSVAARDFCVSGSGCHDIVLRDMTLAHPAVHGFSGYNNNRITLENCTIEWVGGRLYNKKVGYGNGIEFGGSVRDCRVVNCTIAQVFDSAITHQNWDKDGQEQCRIEFRGNRILKCAVGIEVFSKSGAVYDCSYRDNVILDCGRGWSSNGGLWATGFRMGACVNGYQKVKITGNRIENSLHCGILISSGGQVDLDGNRIVGCDVGLNIDVKSDGQPYVGIVHNNLIINNTARGIYIRASSGQCVFSSNTIASNGNRKEWNNNNVTLDGASNTTWTSNILYGTASFAVAINNTTHTLDYNCYYRPSGPAIAWDNTKKSFTAETFGQYQKLSGQDAHSFVGDPNFTNLESMDLTLRDDSPCLTKSAQRDGRLNLGATGKWLKAPNL